MTDTDIRWIQRLAAFITGLAICELGALVTGAPHVTVIFG